MWVGCGYFHRARLSRTGSRGGFAGAWDGNELFSIIQNWGPFFPAQHCSLARNCREEKGSLLQHAASFSAHHGHIKVTGAGRSVPLSGSMGTQPFPRGPAQTNCLAEGDLRRKEAKNHSIIDLGSTVRGRRSRRIRLPKTERRGKKPLG